VWPDGPEGVEAKIRDTRRAIAKRTLGGLLSEDLWYELTALEHIESELIMRRFNEDIEKIKRSE
jgi:hypothetical protein